MARIISAVLVIGVVVYMAVYIFQALSSPLYTSEAVLATIEVTVPVNGWFARDEKLVVSADTTGAVSETVVNEGAKVARGQELIATYDSVESAGVHRELVVLDAQLEQLKRASSGFTISDIAKTDAQLSEALYSLTYASSSGSLTIASSAGTELKTLVLKRDYTSGRYGEEELDELVAGLESRRAELERRQSGARAAVKAQYSGYFSSVVDGYEEIIDMDSIVNMSVAQLKELPNIKAQVTSAARGKIATSFGWRYAVVLTEEQAASLSAGKWVTMRFTGDLVSEFRVRVFNIGPIESGECVVVFSCSTHIGELMSYRRQSAEIVLESYDGVRIPKSALRVDEKDRNGVYVVEGMQAKFLPVNIIRETEGFYLVEFNPGKTGAVRPGDEIIVGSKNLFDGKIVR